MTPVETPVTLAGVSEPSTPSNHGIETQGQVGGFPQSTPPEVSPRRIRKGRSPVSRPEGPAQSLQGVTETAEQGAGLQGVSRGLAGPGASQDDLAGSQGAIRGERAIESTETHGATPGERTGVTETPSVAEQIISTLDTLRNERKRVGVVLWVGKSLSCKHLALSLPLSPPSGWPFHVKRSP